MESYQVDKDFHCFKSILPVDVYNVSEATLLKDVQLLDALIFASPCIACIDCGGHKDGRKET